MFRRQVLATVGAGVLAGCSGGIPFLGSPGTKPLPGESEESWAQFGRTAARRSRNTAVSIEDPSLRWEASFTGGITPPAVVGDVAYVSAGEATDRTGNVSKGAIFALNTESGDTEWKTPLSTKTADESTGSTTEQSTGGESVFAGCPATVHRGSVYVGDGGERSFYGINARTGEQRWNLDIDVPVNRSAAAAGDRIFLAHTEGIHIVDTLGEVVSHYSKPDHMFLSPPAIANGTVYAGSVHTYSGEGHSVLVALDAKTGKRWWEERLGDRFDSLAVDDGILFATDSRSVQAVIANHGTPLWRNDAADVANGSLAVGADSVFVATDNRIVALDRSDGAEQWRFEIDDGYVRTVPTVIDGAVVVSTQHLQDEDRNATTYALDPATGQRLWSHQLPNNVGHSAAAVDDTLYLPSHSSSGGSTVTVLENSS